MTTKGVLIMAIISTTGAASAATPQPTPSQQSQNRPSAEAMVTTHIRGNLYQVTGGVANVFFYTGNDEVILVDAKISPEASAQTIAEVRKISDKPIRRVLLTHGDGDHVNGLSAYPQPITIIAHTNTRQSMVQANAAAAGSLPLPNETFSTDMSVYAGAAELRMLFFGPAHTSGDAVVYIPSEKAAILGDLVLADRDPLIHRQKGGSSAGLVAALKSILQLDADIFLSGHGDPVDRKAVEVMIARVEEKRTRVAALVKQGKSLEEVKKAMGITNGAPAGGHRWPSMAETVYLELTGK